MDSSDVSFNNDDAQPLISYCPALSAFCPADCSARGSSMGLVAWRTFGFAGHAHSAILGLTAALVVVLTASAVLTAVPAYAQRR